jgi:hypothetical protein
MGKVRQFWLIVKIWADRKPPFVEKPADEREMEELESFGVLAARRARAIKLIQDARKAEKRQ